MIPWDYNLAFGTFQASDADSAVNDPIDTPLSFSDASDRPMFGWITENREYLEQYHELFAEFLETIEVTAIIDEAYARIQPYVRKDPTAFCTAEQFEAGVAALRTFCTLRSASAAGQLEGSIPSTDEGQEADSSTLINASGLTLSDMGSMGGGFGGGSKGEGPGKFRSRENRGSSAKTGEDSPASPKGDRESFAPPGMEAFEMQPPEGISSAADPMGAGNTEMGPPGMPGGFNPAADETGSSLPDAKTLGLLGIMCVLLAGGMVVAWKY